MEEESGSAYARGHHGFIESNADRCTQANACCPARGPHRLNCWRSCCTRRREDYIHPVIRGVPSLIRETATPSIRKEPVKTRDTIRQCVEWRCVHAAGEET